MAGSNVLPCSWIRPVSTSPYRGERLELRHLSLADDRRPATDRRAPTMRVRNSRINFRDGLAKVSVLSQLGGSGSRCASSPDGDYSWSLKHRPRAPDRSAEGFGRLSGSGPWRAAGGNKGILDLDLELEPERHFEVAVLLTGRDPGVQGRLSSRAHFPARRIICRCGARCGSAICRSPRCSVFEAVTGRFPTPAFSTSTSRPSKSARSWRKMAPVCPSASI